MPEVERAQQAEEELQEAILPLLRLLTWQDFELLIDLIFANSGWRRIGMLGKTQKTVDLELVLPTTQERAFVQVKSSATQAVLEEYMEFHSKSAAYDRMFFVYHSGKLDEEAPENVTIIGPQSLVQMTLDAGLVRWLLEKVS